MIGIVVNELQDIAQLCCKLAQDYKGNSVLSERMQALGMDLMERAAELEREYDHARHHTSPQYLRCRG
jgi:hypothetical protein